MTRVTPTIQRAHVLCTEVTTLSALFTPAEEINFSALIGRRWGEKHQDEKMRKRQNVNHLRLMCVDSSFSCKPDGTDFKSSRIKVRVRLTTRASDSVLRKLRDVNHRYFGSSFHKHYEGHKLIKTTWICSFLCEPNTRVRLKRTTLCKKSHVYL